MSDNPKCPYCGEEMKLIWTACYSERKGGFFQFQCPKCLACTPRVKTQVDYYKEKPSDKELEEGREAAYDAAMKRERVKGEWIDFGDELDKSAGRHSYQCSRCFTDASYFISGFEWDEWTAPHYCPNCGAEMRK